MLEEGIRNTSRQKSQSATALPKIIPAFREAFPEPPKPCEFSLWGSGAIRGPADLYGWTGKERRERFLSLLAAFRGAHGGPKWWDEQNISPAFEAALKHYSRVSRHLAKGNLHIPIIIRFSKIQGFNGIIGAGRGRISMEKIDESKLARYACRQARAAMVWAAKYDQTPPYYYRAGLEQEGARLARTGTAVFD